MPQVHKKGRLAQFGPHGLLSFGPDFGPIKLGNLNLLIGPNGSGKSNVIEAIALQRSSVADMQAVTRKGGGAAEWIWKGDASADGWLNLEVEIPSHGVLVSHALAFRAQDYMFELTNEFVTLPESATPVFILDSESPDSRPTLIKNGEYRLLDQIDRRKSILAQIRDPDQYPELEWLSEFYSGIRIFRDWSFGRHSIVRSHQPADLRNDRLEEDFSNLGLVLNRLKLQHPSAKRAILAALCDLYDGITDFDVAVVGGTVQVVVTEGEFPIPSSRLSDGTLRYLCLLTILCDPNPPPLICIEEPELGLHPDILPNLADLMVEASKKTQLIVTTHSEFLVDAMNDHPECVITCEKRDGKTKMKRLSKDDLGVWLEKYRLGELWLSGEIGGKRW